MPASGSTGYLCMSTPLVARVRSGTTLPLWSTRDDAPRGSTWVTRREQFLTIRQGWTGRIQLAGHSEHVARYRFPGGRYSFHSSRLRFRPAIAHARRRQTAGSTSHSIGRVATPATASTLPSGLNALPSPRNGRSIDGVSDPDLAAATSSSPYPSPVSGSHSLVPPSRLVVARYEPPGSNAAPVTGAVCPERGGKAGRWSPTRHTRTGPVAPPAATSRPLGSSATLGMPSSATRIGVPRRALMATSHRSTCPR